MSSYEKEYARALKEVDVEALAELLCEWQLPREIVMEILRTVMEEGKFQGHREAYNDMERYAQDKVPRKRAVVFVPPQPSEVEDYAKSQGYKIDGKMFVAHYATNDWKDAKGNRVKNWKGKLHSVWFKPENKITHEDYLKPKTYGL